MAGGTALFSIIEDSLSQGILIVDWKKTLIISLGASIVYLTKNFLTDIPNGTKP